MRSPRSQVIWLICDAAANWVIRELMAEGALPAFQQVADRGVYAAARPPSPNCQTPPALATLFTGAWPWKHGVTGYEVPSICAGSPACKRSGFDRAALQSQPIWEYAGQNGLRYVLSHIPWAITEAVRGILPGCLFAVDGYSTRRVRGNVIPLSNPVSNGFEIGPYHLAAECVVDEILVTVEGYGNHLGLPIAKDGPQELWQPIRLSSEEGTWLRLARCSDAGGPLLMHSGVWSTSCFPDAYHRDFESAAGPFVGEGLGRFYRKGTFGARFGEGGDGQAERWLVNTIAPSAAYFRESALKASSCHPDADLYVFYQPCIDDIEHELLGWCEPGHGGYYPERRNVAWEAVKAVHAMADRHLARLLERFGSDCTIVVSSDHGMAGLSHLAHINEALRECGLLAFDDAGGIDWSRTRIFYHPANNGSLWIHPRALSGGIASSEVGRQVLISAADALRRLRDQETGRPVIEAIYPFDGTTEAGWSPALGDLFLAAADGVDFSAERSPDGQTVVATRKTASHMTNTRRQSLAGIFFACGPAIRPIGDLGEIDNRDVFPFLCEQMRLPRPERIEGRVPASLRV